MAAPEAGQVVQPADRFWLRLRRIAMRLAADKAHAELIIIFDQGRPARVRVNRQYLADSLPDV